MILQFVYWNLFSLPIIKWFDFPWKFLKQLFKISIFLLSFSFNSLWLIQFLKIHKNINKNIDLDSHVNFSVYEKFFQIQNYKNNYILSLNRHNVIFKNYYSWYSLCCFLLPLITKLNFFFLKLSNWIKWFIWLCI